MAIPYIELIERLNTAAHTAEQIADEDKERVNRIKANILEAQRESKEAERIARKSKAQSQALTRQVWALAKKQGVTGIRYDLESNTSRAIFGPI